MIVPMKHVTVLCVAEEKDAALERLAGLGVMHVSAEIRDSAAISGNASCVDAAVRAVSCIEEAISADASMLSLRAPVNFSKDGVCEAVSEVNAAADEYIAAKDEYQRWDQMVRRYEDWGDFDPELVRKLADEGVKVALFRAPLSFDSSASFPEGTVVLCMPGSEHDLCCAAIGVDVPAGEGIRPVPLPDTDLAGMVSARDAACGRMLDAAGKLASFQNLIPRIKDDIKELRRRGEYVLVRENMVGNGVVAHLSGFIPARDVEKLKEAAAEAGWGVSIRDPEPDETPPTLLEPPRLFRPITAIFRGLDIVPGYSESDVSVPFYAFFSIFFAMLIGDAGYGALILAITLWASRKVKSGGRSVSEFTRSFLTIMRVFSISTIVYGILSGTYFGIPQDYLPDVLKFRSVAWLSEQNNIMQLCFTIGVVHLSIARIWNAAVLFPSTKAWAEIGWIGVLVAMYNIICGIVIKGYQSPSWNVWLMVVSVLLIFLFMLNKSELKENAASLGMLPLNVVSSMGDIISYVRLFAVGLASVKVAENFNLMAVGLDMPAAAKIPVMLLILFLGHAMNFAMGALSILVHAVRLNTLEFSGAKGVTWCGEIFKPFAVTSRTSSENIEKCR